MNSLPRYVGSTAQKDTAIRRLASLIREEEQRIGKSAVHEILEKEEISHQDMRRVDALRSLPKEAEKMLENLSCNHAVVVVYGSRLTQREQVAWLCKAEKHRLTPTRLRQSIRSGKIVTDKDVALASGRNSGIRTIEGIAF